MYKILEKTPLNPTVTKSHRSAASGEKAEPGQFIIFRPCVGGRRAVPLTIADYDQAAGTVTIIFQIVAGAI